MFKNQFPEFSKVVPDKKEFESLLKMNIPQRVFKHTRRKFPHHQVPKVKDFSDAKRVWKKRRTDYLDKGWPEYETCAPLFDYNFGKADAPQTNKVEELCDQLVAMKPYLTEAARIKERN